MKFTAQQIAVQLEGTVDGDPNAEVYQLSKIEDAQKVNKVNQAAIVGKQIAEVAQKAGVERVVFDRNGYLYHGRIKSLADSAREGGLKF